MAKKITRGSGNIFADLGIKDADEHRLKADLALKIADIIEKKRLTQKEAAAWIGATQADISNLGRGQFKGFTIDRLFHFLRKMDMDVQVRVRPATGTRSRKASHADNHAYV
jgi:predicted XRE-type DNA-binding protein